MKAKYIAIIVGVIFTLAIGIGAPLIMAASDKTQGETGSIVWNREVTLNVTKSWVDRENNNTYYLVSGYEPDGTFRTIELRRSITDWFANEDRDFGQIQDEKVYTFNCTGLDEKITRQNFECSLVSPKS